MSNGTKIRRPQASKRERDRLKIEKLFAAGTGAPVQSEDTDAYDTDAR